MAHRSVKQIEFDLKVLNDTAMKLYGEGFTAEAINKAAGALYDEHRAEFLRNKLKSYQPVELLLVPCATVKADPPPPQTKETPPPQAVEQKKKAKKIDDLLAEL